VIPRPMAVLGRDVRSASQRKGRVVIDS
jgi:hypothetical protein